MITVIQGQDVGFRQNPIIKAYVIDGSGKKIYRIAIPFGPPDDRVAHCTPAGTVWLRVLQFAIDIQADLIIHTIVDTDKMIPRIQVWDKKRICFFSSVG